jgi:hypothetical protein
MLRLPAFTFAAVLIVTALPAETRAADSEAETMMRMVSECHYVVKIAEGNGVSLKNPSSLWEQLKYTVSERTGLSVGDYDTLARSKWERRQRSLGASDTMRRIADRAKECDAQL